MLGMDGSDRGKVSPGVGEAAAAARPALTAEGAASLRAAAAARFLTASEVALLLRGWLGAGLSVTSDVPSRPPSGTLLVYDRSKTAHFRADGHDWARRRDKPNKVRESNMKLMVGGVTAVNCNYVKSSADPNFVRRVYRMVGGEQRLVLVHYLRATAKPKRGNGGRKVSGAAASHAAPALPAATAGAASALGMGAGYSFGGGRGGVGAGGVGVGGGRAGAFPAHMAGVPNTTSAAAALAASQGSPAGGPMDRSGGMPQGPSLVREPSDPGSLGIPGSIDGTDLDLDELANLLDSDMLDGMDEKFGLGLSPHDTPTGSSGHSHREQADATMAGQGQSAGPALRILDFAPAVSRVSGRDKMLIVLHGNDDAIAGLGRIVSGGVFAQFGATRVKCEIITTGTLRCYVPPAAEVAQVALALTLRDGTPITDSARFEYVPELAASTTERWGSTAAGSMSVPVSAKGARRRSVAEVDSDSDSDGGDGGAGARGASLRRDHSSSFSRDRKLKIRVVERLGKLAADDDGGDSKGDGLLEDSDLSKLADGELETRVENMVESLVLQLAELAKGDADLGDELLALDNAGMSLMHYTCMYSYVRLVSVLVRLGADPNQPTSRGVRPLHLSASAGANYVVDHLLRAGAHASWPDPAGLTAAERAFAQGYVSLAAKLQEAADHDTTPPPPHEALTRVPSFRSTERGHNLSPDSASAGELSVGRSPAAVSAGSDPGGDSATVEAVRNREALAEAFSTLSLQDRIALSLSLGRDPDATSVGSDGDGVDVKSVLSESDHTSLLEALQLMNDEERDGLEDEAKVIQTNVRAWMYRRNYRTMRDATKTLQAATRGMLARKTFKSTRDATTTLQAATRGMLARKNFQNIRRQAMAAMVIQRSVFNRYGASARIPETVDEGVEEGIADGPDAAMSPI